MRSPLGNVPFRLNSGDCASLQTLVAGVRPQYRFGPPDGREEGTQNRSSENDRGIPKGARWILRSIRHEKGIRHVQISHLNGICACTRPSSRVLKGHGWRLMATNSLTDRRSWTVSFPVKWTVQKYTLWHIDRTQLGSVFPVRRDRVPRCTPASTSTCSPVLHRDWRTGIRSAPRFDMSD